MSDKTVKNLNLIKMLQTRTSGITCKKIDQVNILQTRVSDKKVKNLNLIKMLQTRTTVVE